MSCLTRNPSTVEKLREHFSQSYSYMYIVVLETYAILILNNKDGI